MKIAANYCHTIEVAQYTASFKSYKLNGVKMREVVVYQNGQWIYRDKFKAEEREKHETYAQNFIKAMRLHDTKQYMAQLENMKGV
ncbi:hypothetical protein [Pontibacter sp. SGAir0037]|uniref:hypothetical protein n=1 Tax=Pontibacter sp. SGAir0037 TaxID=2571030 RepID=UPI0010CCB460|nr:hypothetical protein [Pontibacter sp. SGAir0037]QCR23763.1 hypothetical protein C1N53_16355 [Pontibacter sp. SGAir0037]